MVSFITTSYSKTIYFNSLNNFQSLGDNNIFDGLLVDENKSDIQIYRTYPIDLNNTNYKFEIRLANINNDEYKSYSVENIKSGKKTKIKNPSWGVVWNFKDLNNHDKIILQSINTNSHDILDRRLLVVKIVKVIDGVESIIIEKQVDDFVSLYSDFNVVSLNMSDDKMTILIGNKELREIGVVENGNNTTSQNIGYFIGAGAKVAIQRATLDYLPKKDKELSTKWDIETLNTYFTASRDVYEGFWEYLDRDIDSDKLRLGGRYVIAIVKSKTGYDIIYIDRAKVNEKNWKTGMLKGRLIDTQFVDRYHLNWYDAMMDAFTVDVYAKFINNSVLELHFPIQNSFIRFAKLESKSYSNDK